MPESSSSAHFQALLTSCVNTADVRPRLHALINVHASSSLRNELMGAIGPNVSSWLTSESAAKSVMTVGSQKKPGRSGRLPPATSVAPVATASSRCRPIFSTTPILFCGPIVVFSSHGSPSFHLSVSATIASTNSCLRLSATKMRSAQEQT